jgi:LysM repeat protein
MIRMSSPVVLFVATTLLLPSPSLAQSLSGSPASMNQQERQARLHDFTFMESGARIRRFVDAALLVAVEGNGDYDLHSVSYPYARPAAKLFIERLASQFRGACGEKLTVTSLTRPTSEQPANAHNQSVHPTGMAIDLRIPGSSRCRQWLEGVLLQLEGTGVLDATRERNPAHYHIALFPDPYEQYVTAMNEDIREYIVQRGDTLSRIARQRGSSVSAITGANGLSTDRILPGQILRIPD